MPLPIPVTFRISRRVTRTERLKTGAIV